MQTAFDAVIVGAGPAGSTAAILLARAGWRVAVIEKQRFPRPKVCGECIAASNLPLLESLGIGDAFRLDSGADLRLLAFCHGNDEVRAALPPAPHLGPDSWGRAITRESLDEMLLQQARQCGAEVFQPCSARALAGQPGAWRVDLRSVDPTVPKVLTARVAILANGSWEALRSLRTRPRRRPRASDLLGFKAHFRGAALRPGVLSVLSFDGGYGGMVMAGDGAATIACCIRRERLDALRRYAPGSSAGELVEAWMRHECSALTRALNGATRVTAWLAAGPLDPGIHLSRRGSPFRIGNAAGEVHPIIGEGMSMAFQSAWLLCAELIRGQDSPAALGTAWQLAIHRRFASQWRRRFRSRLWLAAIFAHIAMRPVMAAGLLALIRAWPALLTHGARWAGKTRSVTDHRGFRAGDARVQPLLIPPRGSPSLSRHP